MPSTVHLELMRRADLLLRDVHKLWKGDRFQNVAFTWAGEVIRDDNGVPINDIIGCDLPQGARPKVLLDMLVRTEGCAVLLIERQDDEVLAVFETHEGSKSWRYPIELHGDVRVLGRPVIKTDAECLGLLWKKGMGQG